MMSAFSIVAKWLLVGRHHTGEHPLWSGYVWRNELADTFVEVVAVPWLAGSVPGTPVMNAWLQPIGKLLVNTCTLDHPRALPLYQRMGFVPYSREDRYIELP